MGPLAPIALGLLVAFVFNGRRRRGALRPLGPDPLQQLAATGPVRADLRIPVSGPASPDPGQFQLQPYPNSVPQSPDAAYFPPFEDTPLPPVGTTTYQPDAGAPPANLNPWDTSAMPPLDGSVALDGTQPYGPQPAPAGQVPGVDVYSSQEQARRDAARLLSEHILTHTGASRDRALIARLQVAMGIPGDGLIGPQTLNAIRHYGGVVPGEA